MKTALEVSTSVPSSALLNGDVGSNLYERRHPHGEPLRRLVLSPEIYNELRRFESQQKQNTSSCPNSPVPQPRRGSLQLPPSQNRLTVQHALQTGSGARNLSIVAAMGHRKVAETRSAEAPNSRNSSGGGSVRRSPQPSVVAAPKVAANHQVENGKLPQRSHSARYPRHPDRRSPRNTSSSQQNAGNAGNLEFRDRVGSIPYRAGSIRRIQRIANRDNFDDSWENWSPSNKKSVEARFLRLPESEDFQRLRTFAIQNGQVINRGDSFRRRCNTAASGGSNYFKFFHFRNQKKIFFLFKTTEKNFSAANLRSLN